VDLKADAAFYEFVRNSDWRLKYTLGYADCFVGVHGKPTSAGQEQEQVCFCIGNYGMCYH
jgi:hypothetical protein